jgi:hypothetical protein
MEFGGRASLIDRAPDGSIFESTEIFNISTNGVKALKEGDLLIISKIDFIPDKDDIKKLITPEWLRSEVNYGKAVIAVGIDRNKRGPPCLSLKMGIDP